MKNDLIENIKSTVNSEVLARLYNLDLRMSGKSHVCLCPFHNDNKPSLTLTDNYHGEGWTMIKCFACGWGGDVVKFAKDIDGNFDRLTPSGVSSADIYRDRHFSQSKPKAEKPLYILDSRLVDMKLEQGTKSNLKTYLSKVFDPSKVDEVFKRYRVGISKTNDSIFWQIDRNGFVRSGKIMKYMIEGDNVRRVQDRNKDGKDVVNWVHSKLKYNGLIPEQWTLTQCMFGEHLLQGNTKPIAIVESEKTAIIASLWNDSVLWLSVGGKQNFKKEIIEQLKGLKVLIFPDMDGVNEWRIISENLNAEGFNLHLSNIILHSETKDKQGEDHKTDLADVILDRYKQMQVDCPF